MLLDLDPPDLDAGPRDAAAAPDAGRDGGPIDGGGLDGGPIDGGIDGGRTDGGPRRDASAGDAGDDGGLDGGGMNARDAGTSCRPDVVEFPMGGALVVGTLCDEIVVCAGEGHEEEIRGAAPSFSCEPDVATFTCTDRLTCAADPTSSVLDDALIAEICALTQLVPTPQIVCRVFL